jgi:hypothetical protein
MTETKMTSLAIIAAAQDAEIARAAKNFGPAIRLLKSARVAAVNGFTVETYRDLRIRSYVTVTHDANGDQIGHADYDGTQESAAISHLWAILKAAKSQA